MSTMEIVWLVVGVAVVLVLVTLAAMWMRRRNQAADRQAADRLRARADEHADLVTDAQTSAQERAAHAHRARVDADRARVDAERAAEEATRAEENLAQQRSEYETNVRSADSLDPDVDTRSKDYAPDLSAVEGTPESTTEPMPDPMPEPGPTPEPSPEPAPMPEPMSEAEPEPTRDPDSLQDAHDSRRSGWHRR